MHPLNNKFFGPTGIAISYNNGTSTVSGYIVRQLGTTRYVATTDGITLTTVQLAETLASATALTAGIATILVTPAGGGAAQHAQKIMSSSVHTLEGNDYIWNTPGTPTASLAMVTVSSSGSSGGSSSGSSASSTSSAHS